MKIIGITGNSGSGKSSVSEIIAKKCDNSIIIDADKIAKSMASINTKYYNAIKKEFGKDILKANLEIDRKKLANIIFNNDEKRDVLNRITFKYVVSNIKQKINFNKNKEVIIIDNQILYQSDLDQICDITLGIIADKNVKIERICKRDKININQAENRINKQLEDKILEKNCNYIIENNGSLKELNEKLQNFIIHLKI